MADFIKGIGSAAQGFAVGSSEVEAMYLGETKIYGKLPYDAEVEYLYSTGSQYINTGIIPTATTGISIKINQVDTRDKYFCGQVNNSTNTRWCIGSDSGGFYYGYGNWAYFTSYIGKNYVELNFLNDKKAKSRNFDTGSVKNSANLPSLSFTPHSPIFIFGSSKEGSVEIYSISYIYQVQISQGNDIVMDLIPVRVGQVGYMYDKVSKQLFGNAGTGSFTLGSDV